MRFLDRSSDMWSRMRSGSKANDSGSRGVAGEGTGGSYPPDRRRRSRRGGSHAAGRGPALDGPGVAVPADGGGLPASQRFDRLVREEPVVDDVAAADDPIARSRSICARRRSAHERPRERPKELASTKPPSEDGGRSTACRARRPWPRWLRGARGGDAAASRISVVCCPVLTPSRQRSTPRTAPRPPQPLEFAGQESPVAGPHNP